MRTKQHCVSGTFAHIFRNLALAVNIGIQTLYTYEIFRVCVRMFRFNILHLSLHLRIDSTGYVHTCYVAYETSARAYSTVQRIPLALSQMLTFIPPPNHKRSRKSQSVCNYALYGLARQSESVRHHRLASVRHTHTYRMCHTTWPTFIAVQLHRHRSQSPSHHRRTPPPSNAPVRTHPLPLPSRI